jgi:hypothetical protein
MLTNLVGNGDGAKIGFINLVSDKFIVYAQIIQYTGSIGFGHVVLSYLIDLLLKVQIFSLFRDNRNLKNR